MNPLDPTAGTHRAEARTPAHRIQQNLATARWVPRRPLHAEVDARYASTTDQARQTT